MASEVTYSKKLLAVVQKLNNFAYSGTVTTNLTVAGKCAGRLTSEVVQELQNYPDVFQLYRSDDGSKQECVKLSDSLQTCADRSKAVASVIEDMRKRDAHVSLRGWRDELFEVSTGPNHTPLFEVERSAVSMLGVRSFGAHMNGYVNHPDKGLCLWIARRASTKTTFPGMLDNMVAGGIGRDIGIRETLIKECEEEASIPQALAENAIPVGMISYVYEDERGIQADVQYCFDLEVPLDFVPTNSDGEVQEFRLHTVAEVSELIVQQNFKPNCAGVTLDFLIRKGFLSPDNVRDYVEIVQLLHYKF